MPISAIKKGFFNFLNFENIELVLIIYNVKKNLLILIPARSNSKTIKNKNLVKIFGKPLIYYSIRTAKKIKDNKKIIFCSTDLKKIKKIVKRFGVDIPFMRPKNLLKIFPEMLNLLIML